jgi:hypothetical protein
MAHTIAFAASRRFVASFALAALASLGALVAGCGHEAFDGRVYHAGRASFRVGPVPASWDRIEVEGAMLAYHDRASGGSIEVHAQCGRDADDVPLVALTNHLLIGFTERDVKLEETVPFDGREARHTVVHAKLDGVPLALDAWVLKKDGCVYDVVFVVPPAQHAANADAFAKFARGFSTSVE